jgi:hypothetical protein
MRPPAARGAPVIVYGCDWSTVTVSQTFEPLRALIAISRPSSVPT